MPQVRGTELTPAARREALARFVHRYTGNHTPAWARQPRPDGTAYPLPFADDAEWLANTLFVVRKDGGLSKAVHYCISAPTWPNNPELRKG